MKAQIATEYMIIVSFALMILVPFILYLQSISRDFSEGNNLTIASNSVNKIGQTADWVYSQGEPAKLKILIQVPNGVETILITDKTITWKVRTSASLSDIYYNSFANLSGDLPTTPGYYNVLVQAIDGGVNISVSPG